ncbi:MAG: aminotransferase class V-fold PLP-dependent enzyme [Lachnospiraceae bacterium]
MKVAFYGRCYGESESRYVQDCLTSGLETDGFFMKMLVRKWELLYPGTYSLFTTSCTTALEMAVACLQLDQGDEVILPSFNFPSAANAVLLHGGIPVLCDIDSDTQNISVPDMMRKISTKTRAVIAVHYAGVSCPMEELLTVAREAGIELIEDAAQAIGAGYIDRQQRRSSLGTIGRFGAVSFHHTKNITCGEGGVMFASGVEDYSRAAQYRLHGTNRSMYLSGETDRYTWNMPGSCSAMGELQAAVLASQTEMIGTVTSTRRAGADRYRERLQILEDQGIARLMKVPVYAEPNGHIFYLRFENEQQRDGVRAFLQREGIDSKTHYVPLHMSPQGQKMGCQDDDLPESLRCYRTLLRLPLHGQMTGEQVAFVSDRVLKACGVRG